MMNYQHTKAQARIEYECGTHTCASEPGKFCRFLGTRRFGTKYLCTLYPSEKASYTVLEEEGGWLQRCNACLLATQTGIDTSEQRARLGWKPLSEEDRAEQLESNLGGILGKEES